MIFIPQNFVSLSGQGVPQATVGTRQTPICPAPGIISAHPGTPSALHSITKTIKLVHTLTGTPPVSDEIRTMLIVITGKILCGVI